MESPNNDKNVIASDGTDILLSKEYGKSQLAWVT